MHSFMITHAAQILRCDYHWSVQVGIKKTSPQLTHLISRFESVWLWLVPTNEKKQYVEFNDTDEIILNVKLFLNDDHHTNQMFFSNLFSNISLYMYTQLQKKCEDFRI